MSNLNFLVRLRQNDGAIQDLSSNIWISNNGSTIPEKDSPFNDGTKGFYFNKSSNSRYPIIKTNNTLNPTYNDKFTICCWVYVEDFSNGGYCHIFSGDSNGTGVALVITTKSLSFTHGHYFTCVCEYEFSKNKWYFIECNRKNNIVTYFVNGSRVKQCNYTSPLQFFTNGYTFKIGQWGYAGNYINNMFNGSIYDFCILDDVWHTEDYNVPKAYIQLTKQGLLTSKNPINFLDKAKVTGFTIDGIQPANTNRKVAFKVDNTWNKLGTNGVLSALPTQEITADSVLAEGNTVEELTALTNVPSLAGKLVYLAIALYASEEAEVMPTFGMIVNAEIDTTVDVYTKTDCSQEFVLHNKRDVLVKSISVDSNTKGNGKVTLKARYATFNETAITEEGAGLTEKWSDYVDLLSLINVKCHKLQIKADYQVSITDGSDSATLNDVIITYAKDVVAKADGSTDLVTLTEKFTNDLTYVHAYIKHKELIDADLKSYVRLQKTPKKADFKLIGYGTGARKTYKVTDKGINQDSLMIYVNGKAVYDFDFNTETSEIALVADVDVPINASYEFGWELFNYVEMQKGVSQVNDSGAYTTEYSYTIPEHEGEYTVTAIKYELIRPEGKVTDEVIGVGTGKRQIIQLPHYARKETISCNGKWSYDYDSKRLTVIAPESDNIVISYDWIAEPPQVYGVMAGWAD